MSTMALTHQRTPLSAIMVNVVLIHAAVLVLMNQPSVMVKPRHNAAQASQAMQLRTIERTPATIAPPAEQAPLSSEPHAEPVLIDKPSPLLKEMPAEPDAQPTSTANAPATSLADLGADDSYLPRPLLTITPAPSAPVIVPFPRQVARPGRYTTTLALFIDENGVVRRVRLEGPSAPQPMQDAARDTFLQAHFSPGQLEGQPVKSLIRVEVVFDNSPLGASTETRSL